MCSQLAGLVPLIVSRAILDRWLATDSAPHPKKLWDPQTLSKLGTVVDLSLVEAAHVSGVVRCYPCDPHEGKLPGYWRTLNPQLEEIFNGEPDKSGSSRSALEQVLLQYRRDFTAGLDTYHIVGDLVDVDQLDGK